MKNKWMKYAGITLGVCLTLSFSPSFANADETGENNLFNLDINLLNEKEDKATIVDIQADNVPILGDLKAQIPAKSPISANTSEEGEGNQQNSALATVELTNPDGLIDDLDISVLEQSSMQDENSAESKSSLASVNLTTPVTNEVEVDVLLSDEQSSEETSSYDGGLVELNAEDLPLLREVHAGVLDGHYKNDEASTSFSSGLIQADLDDGLLDETSVDVLVVDKSINEESSHQSTALASVQANDDSLGGLIDDLDISVLEQSGMRDENSAEDKSSLASVNLSTQVTNEVELDVLLSDEQSGEETSSYDGGLVELKAEDLPVLGEVHAGVLDGHYKNAEESTSVSSGLIQADLEEGLLDETSVDVLAVDKSINEESSQQSTALASVKVDDDSLGGLIDDLDISVLEQSSMQDENSAEDKSSLASVNLTTPITNEMEVDILLSDEQSSEETSSYDGGLVELNAEDLPVLGEVHAGVLDGHYKNDEENTSLSSGLIQADLDDGLLDETSVDVLALDVNTDGKVTSTKHSGVSLVVGNDEIGNLNVGILTNETIQPVAAVEQPGSSEEDTELSPPMDDATDLTPNEDGDVAAPNEETVAPPMTESGTGLTPSTDRTGVSPNVNIEVQTPGNVTEGITPNENASDSMQGGNAEGVSDDIIGVTRSENSASSALEEEIDGVGWATTGSYAMSEDVALETSSMNQNPQSGNGMGKVLPKTGGFFDSIILSLLALLLLVTGLGTRRIAH
ncbi:hypothetical protein [Sporosarcina sp. FSL K6-1508]|uniref:hypothetical protein n=1 Tax=Sporosarcina sp. FSL K6-1508 TaxID=2921553 RepID=UPI0030FCD44E